MDWLDILAVQGTLKSLAEHSSHCRIIEAYFLKFDTTDFSISLSLSFVILTKTSGLFFFLMFSHIIFQIIKCLKEEFIF